jgi:GH15 family glucan-1,4-alpha-glucosidase
VGGERNWDYRYTWIRDASFSVHALLGLGYAEEAAAFGVWVRDRLVEHKSSNGDCPLRIMYRVDGSPDLTEETLDHAGHRFPLRQPARPRLSPCPAPPPHPGARASLTRHG